MKPTLVRPQKGLMTTHFDFEIVTNFRDFDHPLYRFGKKSSAGDLTETLTPPPFGVRQRGVHISIFVEILKIMIFGFKGSVFFYVVEKLFWQKRLQLAVIVIWTRECVRSKAYNLKLILSTYYVVPWPLENFLRTLEVGWCDLGRLKKCSKSWIWGPSESLWEKLENEFGQNFKFSRNASHWWLVATNHACFRVS